jgi:tetratricopeptide (TPR) repeat protein
MRRNLRRGRCAPGRPHCTSLRGALGAALILLLSAIPLASASAQGRGVTADDLRARLEEARKSGASPLEMAELEHNLGRILARDGEFAASAQAFAAALAVRQAQLPADDPEIAASMTGLAVARNGQGRIAESESLFLSALEIRKKAFSSPSPEVASALGNLGALYVQMERWDDAARYYDEAIAQYEDIREASGSLVVALANRASVYEKQGEIEKADELYERIVEEEAGAAGAAGGRVAAAHTALATRYRERGDRKRAEKQYRRALEILGSMDAPLGPSVAVNLEGLGWAAQQDGRLEEAEQHYRRSLTILEETLGRDHAMLIPALEGYASVLQEMGRSEAATAFAKRGARLQAAEDERQAAGARRRAAEAAAETPAPEAKRAPEPAP